MAVYWTKPLLEAASLSSGLGKVCWVSDVKSAKRATGYMLKYATKQLSTRRTSGERLINCSRDIAPWGKCKDAFNANEGTEKKDRVDGIRLADGLGRDMRGHRLNWSPLDGRRGV